MATAGSTHMNQDGVIRAGAWLLLGLFGLSLCFCLTPGWAPLLFGVVTTFGMVLLLPDCLKSRRKAGDILIALLLLFTMGWSIYYFNSSIRGGYPLFVAIVGCSSTIFTLFITALGDSDSPEDPFSPQ